MVEEWWNDCEMIINILFFLIYMLFVIKVLFLYIILYDFVLLIKNICELFKFLCYMYILKIWREGIKCIKILYFVFKNLMIFYFYIVKWNNFICLFIKLNNLLFFI